MFRSTEGTTIQQLIRWAAIGLVFASFVSAAHANQGHEGYKGPSNPRPAQELPEEFKDIGIDEKMGVTLDKSLPLINEKGETVTLGSFFHASRPVILSLVYFNCPGLCNYHLNGLTDGMKELDWSIGDKFTVLSISFDPKESFETAAKKKETYLKVYGRPSARDDWHFLTASPETIKALTASVGFKYKWVEQSKEWAHGSAAIVLTPEGKVSRYLPGVMFEKKDLRLALTEASNGKIGNFVDHFVMFCFRYDHKQSKYTLYAFNVMKAGSGISVLLLGLWMIPFWVRSYRNKRNSKRTQARS